MDRRPQLIAAEQIQQADSGLDSAPADSNDVEQTDLQSREAEDQAEYVEVI